MTACLSQQVPKQVPSSPIKAQFLLPASESAPWQPLVAGKSQPRFSTPQNPRLPQAGLDLSVPEFSPWSIAAGTSAIFTEATSETSVGLYPNAVVLGDLNGDGIPDLIIANLCTDSSSCANGGTLAAQLGNGDGTFQPAGLINSGGYGAYALALRDVNGDNRPDIVVANWCLSNADCSTGNVGVLLGNGDGTFQNVVTYNSGGQYAVSVAVGDLNGDGKLDLVVANVCTPGDCTDGSIGVLVGNGDGTFQPAVSYNSGGYSARWVAVGDLNSDSRQDVVVANLCQGNCSNSVAVLIGNGDGTLQNAATYNSGGYDATSVAVEDLNGDGIPDLAVANNCAISSNCAVGSLGILLGNGDGTFRAAVAYATGGYDSVAVSVADFNGDGRPDLAVVNDCASASNCVNGLLGVLLSNGDGTFQTATVYAFGGQYARAVAVGDVNRDGKPDLVAVNNCSPFANCATGTVGVLLGNGDGTFQAAQSYSPGGYQPGSLALADFNADGKTDAVVADLCASNVTCSGVVGVLLGSGNGALQPVVTFAAGGYGTRAAVVADLNGDHKPDIITANTCYSGADCSTGSVGVLLGNGDGTFQTALSYSSGGYDALAVAVADGDGKLDERTTWS